MICLIFLSVHDVVNECDFVIVYPYDFCLQINSRSHSLSPSHRANIFTYSYSHVFLCMHNYNPHPLKHITRLQ